MRNYRAVVMEEAVGGEVHSGFLSEAQDQALFLRVPRRKALFQRPEWPKNG